MQEGAKKEKLEIMNIGRLAKGFFFFSNKSKEMRQKLEGVCGSRANILVKMYANRSAF